jgi:hypothetical protein
MDGPNKIECFITLGSKGLRGTSTSLILLGLFISYEENIHSHAFPAKKTRMAKQSQAQAAI